MWVIQRVWMIELWVIVRMTESVGVKSVDNSVGVTKRMGDRKCG